MTRTLRRNYREQESYLFCDWFEGAYLDAYSETRRKAEEWKNNKRKEKQTWRTDIQIDKQFNEIERSKIVRHKDKFH